jgi:hypothetical protein
MLQREFTYKGYDGEMHTDTWLFNLTQADLLKLNMGSFGGLDDLMKRMIREDRPKELVDMFEALILSAVGEKSPDGRRFIRTQEIRDEFYQTEAYSQLFTELVTNQEKLKAFVLAIIPDDVSAKILENEAMEARMDKELKAEESKIKSIASATPVVTAPNA